MHKYVNEIILETDKYNKIKKYGRILPYLSKDINQFCNACHKYYEYKDSPHKMLEQLTYLATISGKIYINIFSHTNQALKDANDDAYFCVYHSNCLYSLCMNIMRELEKDYLQRASESMLDTVTINDSVDNTKLSTPKYELLYFYAEWCGYCNRFTPKWNEFINKLNHNKIKPIRYNGDIERDKMNEYKVSGYPTIILNNSDGNHFIFNGNQNNIDELTSFVKKYVGKDAF